MEKIGQTCSDRLIKLAKEGDKKAFEILVQTYRSKICAMANKIINDRSEAEDITQEAFINAYRSIGRSDIENETHFLSWMYRIVSNLSKAKFNERKKRSHKHEAQKMEMPEYAATNLGTDPSQELYRTELAAILNEQMANITEDQREVIIMRGLQGMSCEEMAKILGVPESTVVCRLADARDKLRKPLRKILKEEYVSVDDKAEIGAKELKTKILERVHTPEQWVNIGKTPSQRKRFKIEGLGLSAIGSKFGVCGHLVGYIQLYLELGRKIYGEHHECLQYKEKTAPNIDELRREIIQIIKTPEQWVKMIIKEKKSLKAGGFGIYALTTIFGLQGNPVSSREVFLELGKKIFGDGHECLDTKSNK